MLKKIIHNILKHKVLSAVVLLLILGGGYYAYKKVIGGQTETRYVLATATKGTLVASVSGSGQVSASDQVDVKSKVSGDLVRVNVVQDQEVKEGEILAQVDSRDAARAVSDAEISLEEAKLKLEDLLAPLDAQSLLQAENSLAQAERDLEKAQNTHNNINADTEKILVNTYEDGYNNVSTTLFKLSDYIADLKSTRGTEKSEQEYMPFYDLILGTNSPFVTRFNNDFISANTFYNKNIVSFRGVFLDSDRDIVYKLIKDTLETTKAISQAFESARHMYDAMAAQGYSDYKVASTIDKTRPIIESDLSSSFSSISALQNTIDTIDSTVEAVPDQIKDAELALNSAKEKLSEKKLALEELKKGVDSLDIRTQKNVVAQKEAALANAKINLYNYSIRAPFDGVVIKVNVKNKDSISSSTALATIITKQKILGISLNEIDAVKIKMGQKATVAFDAIEDFTVAGKVVEIDSVGTVSQGVVSYGVKIAFDTQDDLVKPGMSVSVNIITDAKADVLAVPNAAIKSSGGTSYVQVLDNVSASQANSANGITSSTLPRQVIVETGLVNDMSTEITSGLKEGDEAVVRTITTTSATSSATPSAQTQSQNRNSDFRIPGMGGGF